jgi:D-beta-D-heptose 7-phosphate kinase/D-beta-D-heptose 1-phosphate adenosyltransferase
MKLTIVGDVLLDRDVEGAAERLCPDAPVPVVDETTTIERPGGAGLAAVLARRQDAEVRLVTAIADDRGGRAIQRLLADSGVEVIAVADDGHTSEKTRILVEDRSVLRLDRGGPGRLGPLPESVASALGDADAVLVADYGRGLSRLRELRELIAATEAPVVWDPHPRGAPPTAGTTVATPNQHELERFTGRRAGVDAQDMRADRGLRGVHAAAAELRVRWQIESIAVTMGPRGALVTTSGVPFVAPLSGPPSRGDACGAGDSFAVAAAIALGYGSDVRGAIADAVVRASAFVSDGGVRHLLRVRNPSTWPAPSDVDPVQRVRRVRDRGGAIVATGGCFDVLHAGHVATLQGARALGDHLVVLLNGDESVRRLKGDRRPVQVASDRAAVLRSLGCVDDVVVFDEDTPVAALRRLRPDIFVKGGDYAGTAMAETDVLASWGGIVVTLPYVTGRSTTSILDRAGPKPVAGQSTGLSTGQFTTPSPTGGTR